MALHPQPLRAVIGGSSSAAPVHLDTLHCCPELLGEYGSQLLWPGLPQAEQDAALTQPQPLAPALIRLRSAVAAAASPADTAGADHEPSICCPQCGRSFRHRYNLQKHHRLRHTRAGLDRPFECLACGKLFKTRQHLRKHAAALHEATLPGSSDPSANSVAMATKRMPPATDGRLWECRVCLRRFRLERQLRQHQLQHTDRRPHRCHRCLTGFATPAGLAQHAGSTARCLAPTKQTGVRCFVCKRAMFGLSALRRHLISAHCSVVAGACLACQLDFPSVEELQQHMLASHTSSITLSSGPDSVRLQRCRLCPPPAAAFHSDLAPLLRHLASEVHCAAACWRCCLCQRTFADHLAVRRHVAGHLVGQRIHLCPAGCSRLFATRSAARRHLASGRCQLEPDAAPLEQEENEPELCQLCPLDVAQTVVVRTQQLPQ